MHQNSAKAEAARAALAAQHSLDESLGSFTEDKLSEHAKGQIALVRHRAELHLPGCSRCRWDGNGCLSCSADKVLRYYMRKEAHEHVLRMLETL